MRSRRFFLQAYFCLALFASPPLFTPPQIWAQPDQSPPHGSAILRTTVRRVVVDVIVTNSKGEPVEGLTRQDFLLHEDGTSQETLSFEANGFGPGMDYAPPKLPEIPPYTFIDLPSTPEKGPLYVLLYDLVNMDNEDQMAKTVNQHPDQIRGRQQLLKFIQNKPEGARFAIFVRSDGLHLIQGFTSDKVKLLAAVDPHSSHPHLPEIYLMGENMGRGDSDAARDVLRRIAAYFEGIPGRKNLIWFSGSFPLAFFPGKDDGPNRIQEMKTTLNLLSQNRIAIYPVDVRGVVAADYHSSTGIGDDKEPVSQSGKVSASHSNAAPQPAPNGGSTQQGSSLLAGSYFVEDEIARQTGGQAFYSRNDVADALAAATQSGTAFYTLSYSPSNQNYNGDLRHIKIELMKKGYNLTYRRSYFGVDTTSVSSTRADHADSITEAGSGEFDQEKRPASDLLSAIMQHGAPAMHQVLFSVQVQPVGSPALGTAKQMAHLASQLQQSKRNRDKPLQPVSLQPYQIDFHIFSKQFQSSAAPDASINLEFAIAAYTADGALLNSAVQVGTHPAARPDGGDASKSFRIEQELDVPRGAAFLRLAVRDTASNRIGSVEIGLPLSRSK